MAKALKIILNSQREIKREGDIKNPNLSDPKTIPVGRKKINFYLPELNLESIEVTRGRDTPTILNIVSRINKFVENIADDYFLLGLHLICLLYTSDAADE